MLTAQANILLIEDNPINIMVIKKFLEAHYNVDVITSGKKLAMMLQETSYQLILTDINLNDEVMNGIDVVKLVKNNPHSQHIPVIAVTAYNLPDDLAQFKEQGFDDFLTKPVHRESLLNLIKRYIAD